MEDIRNVCLASVAIGSRIFVNGSYGTVKYYGEVKGKDDLWCGVDWDDANRGKHNGTFDGVFYFTTNHPTSGSFIHVSKVDTGRSLAEAIEERYIRCYESLTDEERLLPQRSRDRLIEFVGAEKVAKKISQIQKLQVADVRESRVSYPGDVSSLVPDLKELNLATNLISNWKIVSEILNQLPYLTTLDLSNNRLEPPQSDLLSHPQLSSLILKSMDFTWKDITTLSNFLNCVKSLKLVSNHIRSLDTPPGLLQNLTDLDLSQNDITSWEEILKLGHLPKLSSLNMTANSLSHIFIPENESLFISLESLNLSNNLICLWTDIAELSKLRKLERLILALNPVLKLETAENVRQLIIAKIPTLQFLEGVEITRQERKGAEWDYINKYWSDWESTKEDSKFNLEHPTYIALIQRHGPPEASVKTKVSRDKINLLSLVICCPLIPDKPPTARNVPERIVIGKLKQMIRRWLHISENNLILSYKTTQEDGTEYSIDDDTQFLSFYALSNGDVLCVRW